MYVCYAEQSGLCSKRFDPDQPLQVLAGAVVEVDQLHKTYREQKEILAIMATHGISPADFHAADIYRGRNAWEGVAPADRHKLFDLLLDWAANRKCRMIVSPIDTGRFFDRKVNGCIYSNWFESPYEAAAFNLLMSLQRHHAAAIGKNKGKTMVVFDDNGGHDRHMIHMLSGDLSITDDFTGYATSKKNPLPRFDQIIDTPCFSKSRTPILVQLSDCAAFIVRAYLLLFAFGRGDRYPGEFVVIERWYKKLGKVLWPAGCIDPPGRSGMSGYFKEIRPIGWSAQKWMVHSF
jgi:hypothetical protein